MRTRKNIVAKRMISAVVRASKYHALMLYGVLALLITLAMSTFIHPDQSMAQTQTDKIYHSNATGATVTFHGNSITSKTSNVTNTNNSGLTGFGPKNSMRNMTNPMFLMNKNPLSNLSNPLTNMTNP